MSPATRVPLHEPVFAGNEWAYLKECVDTGWVSSAGAFVTRFERECAARAGVKHAVACSTGTAALHLAFVAVGVKAGDEVIVPSLTFIATANAAVYCGAIPRFADIEDSTLGLDPDALGAWLDASCERRDGACVVRETGRRVGAIVPMHAFGRPCRVDRLAALCDRWGIPLVEDAAEALGSTYRGRACGAWSKAAALSFNGNKILTTGGGGMVLTDDDAVAERARHLSTQAKKDAATYLHDEVGYNYRLPNLNAALGCAQLEKLDDFLAAKRAAAGWYREGLSANPRFLLLPEPEGGRSNHWLHAIRARAPELAARAMAALNAAGLESRPIWTPCHRQPMFEPLSCGSLDRTDAAWRECFNVPSGARLTRADAQAVCAVLDRIS